MERRMLLAVVLSILAVISYSALTGRGCVPQPPAKEDGTEKGADDPNDGDAKKGDVKKGDAKVEDDGKSPSAAPKKGDAAPRKGDAPRRSSLLILFESVLNCVAGTPNAAPGAEPPPHAVGARARWKSRTGFAGWDRKTTALHPSTALTPTPCSGGPPPVERRGSIGAGWPVGAAQVYRTELPTGAARAHH